MEEKSFNSLEYRINFIKLREVWRNPSISKGAKVILMDLLLYGGVQGDIFPSQITLGNNHGYSAKHVRNLLNELRKNGLIDWEKQGYSSSNTYFTNEELYCPIDDLNTSLHRKSISPHIENGFPNHLGNSLPPNSSQLNNSHEWESHTSSKCEKNCDNGIIFDPVDSTATYCECPKGKQHLMNSSY